MKELGDYLREAREAKKISLKEIQEITKIRLTYLEGMERGDFSGIPGEVYRKGFLTSYAGAVGLDSEKVLELYNRLKRETDTQAAPGQTSGPAPAGESVAKPSPKPAKPPKPAKQPSQPKAKKGLWMTAGFVVMAAIAVLLVVAVLSTKSMLPGAAKTTVTKHRPKIQKHLKKEAVRPRVTVTPSPDPEATPTPGETATPSPSATTTPSPSAAVTQQIFPAPVTLYASFTKDVWVRIYKDGQLYEDGRTFHANDTQQLWTAQREIVVTIGDPAGLKLVLNGKDLGLLGASGEARVLKITANGIESKKPVP